MRLWRDVGGLLVALHAAAEDAVDAVGLGEDGRVADRQAGAEAQAEHCGKRRRTLQCILAHNQEAWRLFNKVGVLASTRARALVSTPTISVRVLTSTQAHVLASTPSL